MTKQAVDFYRKFYPPGVHDAFIAMVRHALTDKYADMAGLPKSVLDAAAKPIAAGNDVISGIGGGLLGDPHPGRVRPAAGAPGTRRRPLITPRLLPGCRRVP
ncbi:hypothetical protein QEZ40_000194 [Streptomyces katrae]|uniref:Uncharacterized protein n=1 Tax=Streptomyces katrae TaxID=68223 RepID=A0ABT7GLF6_9ACTN|nr:hypothetical protein [Streptomyces katrae]MDK9494323.1 hypothetical protein [Streptomyces katrae]